VTAKKRFETREEWLNAAAALLSDMIAEKTDLKPASRILVSAGWPRRDRGGKVIGQCYPSKTSMGVNHVFISPTQSSPTRVLDVLLHELVHAADDCQSAHKGPFTKAIRSLGLEGKPTATVAGKELTTTLKGLVKELGPYPHSVLTAGDYGPAKPQKTRMLKIECPAKKECGFICRATRAQIDKAGTPTCGCGRKMKEVKTDG
jgi:hypothetical protein